MKIECPRCGANYEVEKSLTGNKVECVQCRNKWIVKKEKQNTTVPEPTIAVAGSRATQSQRSKDCAGCLLVSVTALLLVTAIAAACYYFGTTSRKSVFPQGSKNISYQTEPTRVQRIEPYVDTVRREHWSSLNQDCARIWVKANNTSYTFDVPITNIHPGGSYKNSGYYLLAACADTKKHTFIISSKHATEFQVDILNVDKQKEHIDFSFSCNLINARDLSTYHKYKSSIMRIEKENFKKLRL